MSRGRRPRHASSTPPPVKEPPPALPEAGAHRNPLGNRVVSEDPNTVIGLLYRYLCGAQTWGATVRLLLLVTIPPSLLLIGIGVAFWIFTGISALITPLFGTSGVVAVLILILRHRLRAPPR